MKKFFGISQRKKNKGIFEAVNAVYLRLSVLFNADREIM